MTSPTAAAGISIGIAAVSDDVRWDNQHPVVVQVRRDAPVVDQRDEARAAGQRAGVHGRRRG